ncbi:lysine--tRNA ligase [Iris pallida]|uniref:Lysine--tRNA ligase n=1 Tax=Iris pallida TaxID=29817 RepID=A0AAX6FIE3_IRIPA|nr:lysine--tRNA ligase [Iris pallida]
MTHPRPNPRRPFGFRNRFGLKVLSLMKASEVNLYPHKFEVSISVVDYVKKYGSLSDGEHLKGVEINLAGRIMNKRTSSSKLYFYDPYSGGAKVQVMADASIYFKIRTIELDGKEDQTAYLGYNWLGAILNYHDW